MAVNKMRWQDRISETEKLHKDKLRENITWRIEDTAKMLNRSDGRISEDLTLASWSKTYPQILDFEYVKDALTFVRNKKLQLRLS